jgi:hypothetical protein
VELKVARLATHPNSGLKSSVLFRRLLVWNHKEGVKLSVKLDLTASTDRVTNQFINFKAKKLKKNDKLSVTMESFEYAPWVVLFSMLVFIIFYGGCILGQQIMKLPETGKDSLILFSTERTYRSFDAIADYVLLFTRLVSFGFLLVVAIIYLTIASETTDKNWSSFVLWNCLLVEVFFTFSLANSFMGLCVHENSRCCLTHPGTGGYYYYALFMQTLFVVSGAASLFAVVVVYLTGGDMTSLEYVSYSAPALFMLVEMILGT